MATCCTNVVVGSVGYALALTPPSTGRPRPGSSALCRCSCAQLSQRRSWGTFVLVREESRGAPRRRRLRDQQQRRLQPLLIQQQPQTESPPSPSFCCLPTDVSSDASSASAAELNRTEGTESGMSIEEKNAILAFEAGGLSAWDGVDDSEEGRSSSEYLQLSSSEKEEEDPEVKKEREQELAELRRRASKAVKGQADTLANIVAIFLGLLDRPSPGDGRMLAGAGRAVIERVEEEVARLQGVEGVDGQSLFEILRLVKLLQMDIQLIAAARKESTLSERLVQAKAHCRQFLNILTIL